MEEITKSVSEPTLRRLPAYHRLLKAMQERGRPVASCTKIAAELGLDPTQVRKDLAATGAIGKPKVGFMVDDLVASIERFLGWNNTSDAVVVGAGHLGTALMGYKGFANYQLKLLAAFDNDPKKIGRRIHGLEVFPLEKLADLVQRLGVRIAVLTVPAEAAQSVTNLMVLSGIEGIWNFTQMPLETPAGICVENIDLSASLAVLSRRLAEGRR